MTEPEVEDKRVTLAEAAKKVHNGATLAWGGFGFQRAPIAFSHELVRQGVKDLTITTCGSEVDIEIMAGSGVASRFEIAFAAIEALGLSYVMRRRVAEGAVEVEDYTNLAMAMRFLGGALNVPFMPLRSMMGTDMACPTSIVPWPKSIGPAGPDSSVPITLSTSLMAPSGQLSVQLPQP